jgi:hypothetical protein
MHHAKTMAVLAALLFTLALRASANDFEDLFECVSNCIDDPLFCQQDCAYPGDGVTGTPLNYDDKGATVVDENTGLEWLKKDLTQGSEHHRDVLRTYAQAEAWVAGLGGGWRLPNLKELMSLLEFGSAPPVINPVLGPVAAPPFLSYYWSTTPSAVVPSQKMLLDFLWSNVIADVTTDSYRTLAVR